MDIQRMRKNEKNAQNNKKILLHPTSGHSLRSPQKWRTAQRNVQSESFVW